MKLLLFAYTQYAAVTLKFYIGDLLANLLNVGGVPSS